MKIDLHAIKRDLEFLKCSEHGEKPKISVLFSDIKISCCCDTFRKKVETKSAQLIEVEAKKAVEKELKNLFK